MDVHLLFREHHTSLLRFLQRRGVDVHDASDIAQDAFIRLLSMDTAQPIGNIRAYLFAITRNLATNAARRRKIAPFLSISDDLLDQIDDGRPSPEEVVLWRQELGIVRAVFAELTPQQKQIFYLSRIEGCTFAQIGALLGVPPATAYGQLTRILVRMQLRLDAAK